MGTEIERKFLVDVRKLPKLTEGVQMTQFYLSRKPTVRVRFSEGKAWMTVKGPGTIIRAEFEWPIPIDDAKSMVWMAQTPLVKTRYRVQVFDHVWEVDQFHGALEGLWLAEIELASPEDSFVKPEWVTKDVTFDVRYTNVSLYDDGRPAP